MRTLILLIAIVAAVLIIKHQMGRPGFNSRKFVTGLVLALVGALFVFLLVTGRMHWIFALLAALVPLFKRLLPLLRYLPFLHNLYRRHQTKKQWQQAPRNGQQSTVTSRYLSMTLNHESGDLDGEILEGPYQGQHLSALNLDQVLEVFQACRQDQESASLLEAYLDRVHTDWREKDKHERATGGQSTAPGDMSVKEAYEILGLEPGADQAAVLAAHRRLIHKLHPDVGGSNYLAARINKAKDRLMKLFDNPA